MRRITIPLLLCVLLSGCAYINIPLGSGPAPFQEVQVFKDEGMPVKDKVLLMEIDGPLMTAQEGGLLKEGRSMVSDVREKLQMAEKDPKIKAVILRVNSPGGSVSASDMIYEELRRFKAKKSCPMVASFLDVAASGGYYVSMSCDHIMALPTSVTGSIGVLMQMFGVQTLMGKLGVEDRTLTSGDMKDAGSPFRAMTEKEKVLMKTIVDEFYGRFVSIVDEGRPNLNREQVLPLADGRVYTGQQALDAGLVDALGYLPDAISKAKDLANLKGCQVVAYRRSGETSGTLYETDAKSPDLAAAFQEVANTMLCPQFLYLWSPGFSLPIQ